nr:hypothetical protein [Tanacetum cinerariifolium]
MSTPKFAKTHNLVAFLEKPTKSERFEQIIDFLNANPIKYALTVNPIIYTSCIKQFWATAKVNNVNGEDEIQALVDKKKMIIIETSVRSDLQLEDDEATEYMPNATIFEHLTLTGVPTKVVADEAIYKKMYNNVERAATTTTGLDVEQDRGIIMEANLGYYFKFDDLSCYNLTPDSARSYVMLGALFTQGTVSSIPIGGGISLEGFLPPILLLVMIIAMVVVTVVVVVVVSGVPSILKLSFMVIGFLYRIVF